LFIIRLTIFFDISDGKSALTLAEEEQHWAEDKEDSAVVTTYTAIVNTLRAAGAH
jgi:hypothetical protein